MPNSSQLPLWVSYLQALAVPVIAVVGAWIAARQAAIADEKLEFEKFYWLYDRRVVVYEATRQFLADVYNKSITDGKIQAYGLRILDAKILFDEGVYKYLAEIRQRVEAWNLAKSDCDFATSRPAEIDTIASKNLEDWIKQQGDEENGFEERFRRFLVPHIKRRWSARQP